MLIIYEYNYLSVELIIITRFMTLMGLLRVRAEKRNKYYNK